MRRFLLALLLTLPMAAQSFAIFRSTNQGSSWTKASTGLPSTSRINALAQSSANYVAATDQGIFISRDEANSWQRTQAEVRALSLASLGPTVFAGTSKEGLLRSLDSGQHWQPVAQSQFRYVRSLVAHEGAIYAGTDAQGVYFTTDIGATWQTLSSGLPAQAQVFSMVMHQGALYAALYRKGLYKLDPQLKIWTKMGDVVPLALASSGEALFAGHNPGGIQMQSESNAKWTPAILSYAPQLGNAPVWELSSNRRLALAGVAAYIYRSIDNGRTWTPLQNGIPPGATGIAFLIQNNVALAAASLPLR